MDTLLKWTARTLWVIAPALFTLIMVAAIYTALQPAARPDEFSWRCMAWVIVLAVAGLPGYTAMLLRIVRS